MDSLSSEIMEGDVDMQSVAVNSSSLDEFANGVELSVHETADVMEMRVFGAFEIGHNIRREPLSVNQVLSGPFNNQEMAEDDSNQSQENNISLGQDQDMVDILPNIDDNINRGTRASSDQIVTGHRRKLSPDRLLKYKTQVICDDNKNEEELRVTEIPPQNIVNKLVAREILPGRRCGMEKYLQRSKYQSIFPNFTVTNVDKPPCFLRKFTPDGTRFIAFSADQMSIEVYNFKGPQAAAHLFAKRTATSKTSKSMDQISSEETDSISVTVRKNIFDAFFQLKFRIGVAPPGEQLNRECSLFTENSQFIIVGSTSYIQDDPSSHPPFHEIYRNNESVDPNPRSPLEDYTIHLVDIQHGRLEDSRAFKFDKIFLSHNQGIYLYNNTLAILSVQHQTIHIFHIMDDKLVEVRTIGRFCYEDDELISCSSRLFGSVTPFEEMFMNSLKHRLLVYVFKRAHNLAQNDGDLSGLSRFHQYYEQLRKLRIWKMQLLDEDHLLLKYSSEDVVTLKCQEPNSQHCVLVVYNIPRTEIVTVFENTSDQFVDLFENFSDCFRNNFISQEARYSSSPSNNIHAREIHRRFRQTITSARFGGPVEATRRILAQLPISAQSYSASPYLDQALFSYDDHRVSSMERPKACGEIPIRFYGRDSNLYKFQIHAGMLSRVPPHSSGRRLVAFTFHPSAPFAISVQRANAEYLVNFHIRLDSNSSLDL
ncbi:unnamed protein product [Allacma fusca]|uniref:DET1 homolog n=1 Tax=Allacma fusca TaxID=39272 RepID=A0A8J2PW86_9HEXA|nr:unnamed protein product [Allacma fusca]